MDGVDIRTKDRSIAAMVEGLRAALTDPAKEHRLFKSGKLRGLFGGRNGIPGDAAAEAMRLGYLDLTKTEQKGRARIEWVRLTDRGVEFLYEHDTPRAILTELHATLQSTRSGVPGWLTAVADQLTALGERFTHEMQRYMARIDALSIRVEEAIRRVDAGVPPLAEGVKGIVPWGLEALTYLDHRKRTGTEDPCPLPELFSAVHRKHPQLSVPDFQKGLRRLVDNRALRLLPFTGREVMPQPEHAVLDAGQMLYFVVR